MGIQKITAYTTSDGAVFTDEGDARKHQVLTDLEAEYQEHLLYGNKPDSYVDFDYLISWMRERESFVRGLLRLCA